GTALAAGTCPDLTALRPRKLPHDIQAQPYSAKTAPVAGLALHEPLEDAFMVAGCDPDALVVDGDLDPLTALPRGYRDGPAIGRVLERVFQQLPDDDVGG